MAPLAALVVLAVLLGLLVRCLTRNATAAYGTALVLIAALTVAYFVNQSWFEGLLPAIMKKLSCSNSSNPLSMACLI